MQFKLSVAALILASATPVLSNTKGVQAPPYNRARSHRNVARSFQNNSIEKRGGSGAPGTYYDVTTGEVACGGLYQPHDFIVAMNSPDFAGGSACGKSITISYHGITVHAIVRDECPSCGAHGIDMTQGLFTVFAATSVGEIFVDWSFGGSAEPAPTHKAPPPPPPPKPTSTYHYVPPTTTHTTTHYTTHTTSSSYSVKSSTSSSAAAPSATVSTPSGANNVASLFQAFVGLGEVAIAGVSN